MSEGAAPDAFTVDLRAEALLLTLQQQHGGDLRAAFVVLCGCASLSDVTGEAYEAALARAVGSLFGRAAGPLPAPLEPSHAAG